MPPRRQLDFGIRSRFGAPFDLAKGTLADATEDSRLDGLHVVVERAGACSLLHLTPHRVASDVLQVSAVGVGHRR